MTDTSAKREQEIRDYAEGEWSDGKAKIPEGVPSFTRDLLAMLDRARQTARDLQADAMWSDGSRRHFRDRFRAYKLAAIRLKEVFQLRDVAWREMNAEHHELWMGETEKAEAELEGIDRLRADMCRKLGIAEDRPMVAVVAHLTLAVHNLAELREQVRAAESVCGDPDCGATETAHCLRCLAIQKRGH